MQNACCCVVFVVILYLVPFHIFCRIQICFNAFQPKQKFKRIGNVVTALILIRVYFNCVCGVLSI